MYYTEHDNTQGREFEIFFGFTEADKKLKNEKELLDSIFNLIFLRAFHVVFWSQHTVNLPGKYVTKLTMRSIPVAEIILHNRNKSPVFPHNLPI